MYSDSIRERQQELLDVLFKKASGRSESTFIKSAWPQPTGEQLDILRRTLTPGGLAAIAQEEKVKKELALKEEYQRLENDWKIKNPNAPLTPVTKGNLMRNAERNVKDRSVQESYKQIEQDRLRSMGAFSPTPPAPAPAPVKPSAEGAVSLPKPKVDTPSPVEVGEVDVEDFGYDDPGIQFPGAPDISPPPGQAPASTPTPVEPSAPEGNPAPTPTPTPEGNPTPTTPPTTPPTPAGDQASTPGTADNTHFDWNKLIDGILDRVKRHKLMSIGGLGGAGLGALFGGESFTDRLLWALLGGGAGTGLGYLAEKYLK